jgi:hypothetical protein
MEGGVRVDVKVVKLFPLIVNVYEPDGRETREVELVMLEIDD